MSTDAGLLKRRSVPTLVLGNAITSRMDRVPQRIAMSRSKPRSEGAFINCFENRNRKSVTKSYTTMRRRPVL